MPRAGPDAHRGTDGQRKDDAPGHARPVREHDRRISRTTSDIADAAGNISRQLSPAQFTRWWEKNKAVADVLFDGAERKVLDKLAADFAETSVVNTARARVLTRRRTSAWVTSSPV